MIAVSIIGGSGYAGGELLRMLLSHPQVVIQNITSQRFAGMPVSSTHPNLRRVTSLTYCGIKDLTPCDIIFVALPNGESMKIMGDLMKLAPKIIDLGADYRLNNEQDWNHWYKTAHTAPHFMKSFIYGIPEIYHDHIASASYVAGPGCEAIISTLSLYPFIQNNLIDPQRIIIDAKMGSSQAGNKASSSSHHPERSGLVRSYKPTGHRHTAEIEQVLKELSPEVTIDISATAVEMVRGILVTVHTSLREGVQEKDIWQALRSAYANAPFVRIVKERTGLYRFPEPKILQGSNYVDIGFEIDSRSRRLVIIGAIDNLVKGTAGNGIQCMNLMHGFPETMGLEFPGLHPI